MRKKLLYLVAFVCSLSMSTMAQDSTATCNDSQVFLTLYDQYDDGWGYYDGTQSSLTIDGVDYTIDGGSESFVLCLDLTTCTDVLYTPANGYYTENSWDIVDPNAVVIASGGYNSGTVGDCGVLGCMDASACNYDALATTDNGCTYAAEGFDCAGDCLSGDAVVYTAGSYASEHSFTITDCDGNVLAEMMSGVDGFASCVALPAIYSVNMLDAYNDGWDGATLTVAGMVYDAESVYNVGSCPVYGCTDSTAANYNVAADTDDASCTYGIPGCIDDLACNFDSLATADDNSCTYAMTGFDCDGACLSGTAVEVSMSDSYGDGWNGNVLAIGSDTLTIESGDSGSATLCLADGIYTVTNGGGLFGSEVSWSIDSVLFGGSPFEGSINIGNVPTPGCTDSNAFNFDSEAGVDDGSCEAVAYGCIDPIAENYNADANTDDESCTYVPGCTDNTAVNYSPSATEDDGSCQYVSCLETEALLSFTMAAWATETSLSIIDVNGQELAFIQGGGAAGDVYTNDLCLSTANSYTAILMDSYGDGWGGASFSVSTCDGSLVAVEGTLLAGTVDSIAFAIQSCDSYVFGCMDTLAFNFNENANEEDGSCLYYGCTDVTYLEFDTQATDDDGSCLTLIVEGCTDMTALNYSAESNTEDGSCEHTIVCEEGLSGIAVTMIDNFGDGWQGAMLTLSNPAGETVVTGVMESTYDNPFANGSDSTFVACVLPGCYVIAVDGGLYSSEVSWSIATTDGGMPEVEGDAPANVFFSIASDEVCNEEAFAIGCTDVWASNFDVEASTSCEDCCTYVNSLSCDNATSIVFDSEFNGTSGLNQWFTFTTEASNVLLASVFEDGYSDVEFVSEVYSSCDDTAATLGALDAGTYFVNVSHNYGSTYNVEYSAMFSLVEALEGCTDQYAANFNENANIEDGSCEYPCEGSLATLNVHTVFYGGEVSFQLLNGEGILIASGSGYENNTTYSVPLCLQEGVEYTMNSYDSYGDSWNGGTYEVIVECDSALTYVAANNGGNSPSDLESVAVDGFHLESVEVFSLVACSDIVLGCMDETMFNYDSLATVNVACIEFMYGCTDMDALNYDESVNTEDESCVYGCPDANESYLTLTLTDAYADGWCWADLCNSVTIDGVEYSSDAGSEDFSVCLDLTVCQDITFNENASYASENAWSISDADGNLIISSSVNGSGGVVGDCGVFGCMDTLASNFNVDATIANGSCEYECPLVADGTNYLDGTCYLYVWTYNYTVEEVESYGYDCSCVEAPVTGCMDTEADNYDSLATQEGQCEYTVTCNEGESLVSIEMVDSWGDGWNGNQLTISNGVDTTGQYGLLSGTIAYTDACIDMTACNTITVGGGYSAYEVSWSMFDADGALLLDGGAPDSLFVGACVFPGCTDETAFNYDSYATVDDSTCIAVVGGCTSEDYAEYTADANTDDGSCATLLCTFDIVSLNLVDSYGDSWNGGFVTINGVDYTQSGSIDAGLTEVFEVCVDLAGCTDVVYTAGSYSYENSWSISDAAGVVLAEAGDASGTVGATCAVLGCMDLDAVNYNIDATEDDDSCDYDGCTDVAADNFDPIATIEDGSCQYSCAEGEGQVDILVTTDGYANETGFSLSDGTDTYSVDFTSENNLSTVTTTFCIVNGSFLTFTLTDSYGDGILNGGYQIYICEESVISNPDFSGVSEASEEFMVACGDIAGCMDAIALNYNDIATVSDDSCEYPFVCDGVTAEVAISTAAFGGEMGWFVSDADSNLVAGDDGAFGTYEDNSLYMMEICLVDGADYSFNMSDAFGDGWNGGTFAVTADCGTLAEGGLLDGSADAIAFTACGGSTDCEVPASWMVTITGANHTIMVPGDAAITVDDVQVADGSAIGVFFTNSNGDLQCAGYTVISGSTAQVAAMGDDTTTDEVDGLVAGEALTWMIWDGSTCTEVAATAIYSGGADVYTTNGITFVESIASVPAGPTCQSIDLPSGWSMFSTYMIAADMDLMTVLAPIVENVIIVKNNSGLSYLTEWQFNGIGELVVGQGYQIKTDAAVSLEICGDYAFPEDNTISLSAGWNMIGYLRTEPSDALAVLADINATDNLIIAKDYSGAAYLPQWAFNGIGDMVPGDGYQIKITDADVLTFLSNDESYRISSVEVSNKAVSHFATVAVTDNNMTVVIEDAAWDVLPTAGAEIAAFDKAGNLIGSAVYASPLTVIAVWGDDATTATKDGLALTENVTFKVWSNNSTNTFEVSNWVEGSASYDVNAINVASEIVTNVLTDVIATERVLVKVVNVLGQEVISNEESFKGEILFNVYNDGTVEKIVK